MRIFLWVLSLIWLSTANAMVHVFTDAVNIATKSPILEIDYRYGPFALGVIGQTSTSDSIKTTGLGVRATLYYKPVYDSPYFSLAYIKNTSIQWYDQNGALGISGSRDYSLFSMGKKWFWNTFDLGLGIGVAYATPYNLIIYNQSLSSPQTGFFVTFEGLVGFHLD